VALISTSNNSPTSTDVPPPPTAPVGVTPLDDVPEPLADAVERLENEVQP
jgi:hypothetical protein